MHLWSLDSWFMAYRRDKDRLMDSIEELEQENSDLEKTQLQMKENISLLEDKILNYQKHLIGIE